MPCILPSLKAKSKATELLIATKSKSQFYVETVEEAEFSRAENQEGKTAQDANKHQLRTRHRAHVADEETEALHPEVTRARSWALNAGLSGSRSWAA